MGEGSYIYEMSPLNVYKASAGSGKTFSLTLEYLKLLFKYPRIHRHILAVTFTNKAAGQMKQRILGKLDELSRYDGSVEMEEMATLMEVTGEDKLEIRLRAGKLLKTILNDYSGFSVGTIDKFFQSVIRAFTAGDWDSAPDITWSSTVTGCSLWLSIDYFRISLRTRNCKIG